MLPTSMRCYLVEKISEDRIEAAVQQRPLSELPPGDVVVEVAYSAINYKDALAAQGHPGVARSLPHVPGVDAAGTVVQSDSPEWPVGSEVLMTSYELGSERWGGWAEYIRVSSKWLLALPAGLSLEESMILGTAGLTAGLSVGALQHHAVLPDSGDVVVTGSTGGVGSVAVMLLSRLGYHVTAVTGKTEQHAWLKELGASQVLARDEIMDDRKKPLLSARWAGAVDTVGGTMLAALLKSLSQAGCIACSGLVGGAELPTTVYPFILRGVTLTGIDSGWCPMAQRQEVWNALAGPWKPDSLHSISHTIGLDQLAECVAQILAGRNTGRTVVDLNR